MTSLNYICEDQLYFVMPVSSLN